MTIFRDVTQSVGTYERIGRRYLEDHSKQAIFLMLWMRGLYRVLL